MAELALILLAILAGAYAILKRDVVAAAGGVILLALALLVPYLR